MTRSHIERIGSWLCLSAAALGALGMVAAVARVDRMVAGELTMAASTALGLFAVGTAGVLRAREDAGHASKIASIIAGAVALTIGLTTLAEHGLGIDWPLDGIVGRTHASSPTSALALTLLAAAVLLFDSRPNARVRPSELFVFCAALVTFAAVVGFVFAARLPHRLVRVPGLGVRLPSAVGLLLACSGLLLERPSAGLMRVLLSAGPGGVLLRRLVPLTILSPAVLGLVVEDVLRQAPVTSELAVTLAVFTSAMSAIGVLVLSVAATSLERAHATVDSSRAQLRNLFEQAPDGIFVADLDGRYIDVNGAGCKMLGFSHDEIVGKTIMDLIPQSMHDKLAHQKEQLLAGAEVVSEWMLRRRDGAYLPVEVSAKILPDGRWQGFVRDIYERHKLESEQAFLSEVGSVLATTLDVQATSTSIGRLATRGLADVCIVLLIESHTEARRIVAVSRTPEKQALCDALVRMPVARPPVNGVWAKLEANRLILLSRLSPEEVASFAQSEEHLRILLAFDPKSAILAPLFAHGRLVGAIVLLSTDSARLYSDADVRLVEQVAQRAAYAMENALLYAEAQRAIQSRDSVLSVVAHDLRNPLGNVLMQAALLRRPGGEPERRSQKPVQMIERAGKRMNRIIQDLLDLTRIEEGRISVERVMVSTRQAIADVVEVEQPLVRAASHEIELEVSRDLPDVWADRDRLLQIFENLIGNAIKFTPSGGTITVGAAPSNGDVMFWVEDTGPGIPPESVPHVFDRFWQAQRSERHGVGLGLAIVKGLVEAHRGRVWVESTVGRGTTFFFTIPSGPRAERSEEAIRGH